MIATAGRDAHLPDAPSDLRRSLATRNAWVTQVVRHPPKAYVWATAPTGSLFAWYSSRAAHAAVVDFEARVRESVGANPPLRSPPLLDRGKLWRLEQAIAPEPLQGAKVVEAILAAADELARLRLPCPPPLVAGEPLIRGLRRRVHTLATRLPTIDFLRARRVIETSPLPRTLSHGTFDPSHVLIEDGVPWVVDWDQSGERPAGFDLMTMWAVLEAGEDRELLFEGAVRAIGSRYRRDLLRLRYAVLTRVIATMLADPDVHSRDPDRGRTLLPLLASARREAFKG